MRSWRLLMNVYNKSVHCIKIRFPDYKVNESKVELN